MHGRPYLNYAIIGMNILIFVWEITQDPNCIINCTSQDLLLTYGTVPDNVFHDPSTGIPSIFTSMFMHAGIVHIAGNMLFLFVFGGILEDTFGRTKYILLYLGWGVAAAMAHSAFAVATGAGSFPAIGASGAISGVLGTYLVLYPRANILTIFTYFIITVRPIRAMWYIPVWFGMQVIFMFLEQANPASGSGVAYMAHIGGFAAGIATGLLWRELPKKIPPPDAMAPGIRSSFGMRNPMIKKARPKIEDLAPVVPEVIEGADYYEVIAEMRGVDDASNISASYEPNSRQVRITASGSRKYNLLARLPDDAANPTVKYIQYLNGIARIRLAK
jgi:membrane associated rhomboid family serine protease/HSP20 family molecular chaperone IbpA